MPAVMFVGFVSDLDRSIILSKFVVSGVSRCPRLHTGAKHHSTFRARVNSVRNPSHTDPAIFAARHVSNSIAFEPVSNVPAFHTFERVHHAHRFKYVLWAFTAFLFSRRATDAVFRKSRHLATFGWTDAPAQIRDAHKTGLLKFARGMGVQK